LEEKKIDITHLETKQNPLQQKLPDKSVVSEADSVKETLRKSLQQQSNLQSKNDQLEKKIQNLYLKMSVLNKPDPVLAIEFLLTESDPRFVYICTSLAQKKELLNLALNTHHSDTIMVIIKYLKISLSSETFDLFLRKSKVVVDYYLKYLIDTYPDRKEWKRVLILNQRYEELALYYYEIALRQHDTGMKVSKLQDCWRFIKTYRCMLQYQEEIEKNIVMLGAKVPTI